LPQARNGRGRVTLVLDLPSREVEIALPGGFRVLAREGWEILPCLTMLTA
jgi:hypothetical protein